MTNRMHETHDIDLLAALAEGRLDDPRPAEELVSSCPECAELYHTHRTVLEAVRRQPRPELTEMESRRIRTRVWDEIGVSSDSPARQTPVRSTPAWYRVLGVAAALAVVVGVAGVIVRGGGEDSGLATIAAESSDAGGATTDAETLRALADASESAATTAATSDTVTPEATIAADGGEADEETVADTAAAPPAYTQAGLEPALESFLERYRQGAAEFDTAFPCGRSVPEDETIEAAEPVLIDSEPVWFVVAVANGAPEARAYRQDDCQVLSPSE